MAFETTRQILKAFPNLTSILVGIANRKAAELQRHCARPAVQKRFGRDAIDMNARTDYGLARMEEFKELSDEELDMAKKLDMWGDICEAASRTIEELDELLNVTNQMN